MFENKTTHPSIKQKASRAGSKKVIQACKTFSLSDDRINYRRVKPARFNGARECLSAIPANYGKHDIIRKRFMLWSKSGIFHSAFSSLTGNLGKSNIATIDSTFTTVPCTSCRLKSDGEPRQIGLTRGARNAKTHMIANIEEKPIVSFSRPGERLQGGRGTYQKNIHSMKKLLAEKAYDTNGIRETLRSLKV